jgi:hypothetical protein
MNIGSTLIQATNLVLLISNSNADVRKFVVWTKVGENLTEVLQNMQIERIAVEDTAKVFEHPLETGAVIVDHEIFEPKRATIQAYIANDDMMTLKQLEQLYLSGTILTIRAQNKVIDKVIIASKPHEITGQVFDKTLYSISFREAQEVTPTYAKMPPQKVRRKANASRVNSGVKQATPVNKSWIKSAIWGGRT